MQALSIILFIHTLCAATAADWTSYSLKDQANFLLEAQRFLKLSLKAQQRGSHSTHWPHISDTLKNIESETIRDLNACVIAFFDAASPESDAHDSDDTTDLLSRPKVTKTPSRLTSTDLFKNGKFHKEVQKLIKRYSTGARLPSRAIWGRNTFYCTSYLTNDFFDEITYLSLPIAILDKSAQLFPGQKLTKQQADEMIFSHESKPTITRALETRDAGAHFIYANIPLRKWWRDSITFSNIATKSTSPNAEQFLQRKVEKEVDKLFLEHKKP